MMVRVSLEAGQQVGIDLLTQCCVFLKRLIQKVIPVRCGQLDGARQQRMNLLIMKIVHCINRIHCLRTLAMKSAGWLLLQCLSAPFQCVHDKHIDCFLKRFWRAELFAQLAVILVMSGNTTLILFDPLFGGCDSVSICTAVFGREHFMGMI